MKHPWFLAVAFAFLVCGLTSAAPAAEPKLLIATIDQVTWHDLLSEEVEVPAITGLAQEGAVGLMCVRTACGWRPGGGYLTLGAGARAGCTGAPGAETVLEGASYHVDEIVDGRPAGRLFSLYTGWPVGDNRILHTRIGQLIRENTTQTSAIHLGLLGGTLRRSELRVACIGNADTPRHAHREIVAIGMDEEGLVEMGSIGADLLRTDPDLPYRVTVRPERILAAVSRAAALSDLIVLELGETTRLADYAPTMPPLAAQNARYRAIERADTLLGQVLGQLDREQWAVLLLTPTVRPPDSDEQFAYLAPIIFSGPGVQPGLLTSPSTRHPGLVVNTDVAATVLDYFDLDIPADTVGRPIAGELTPDGALASLEADLLRHDLLEVARRHLFRWVGALGTAVLWLAAFLLLLGESAPRWTRTLLRALLLLLLAAPAAMLLVALRPLPLLPMLGTVVGGAIVLAFLSSWITSWRSGHILPAITLVGLIVYDLIKGQAMLQWSPFSYSAASGARFYGIGNEYAGAFLGAALIAASGLLSRRDRSPWGERPVAALALLAFAVIIGYPEFGANLGMALACAVGFAVFGLYLWHSRPVWTDALAVLLVVVAVGGAAVAVDVVVYGSDASHIGRWFSDLRGQGWSAVSEVVARKATMNWRLVRVSLWADLAMAALGVLVVALLAKPRSLMSAARARSWLTPAAISCTVGAAAAFLLNDSGIVSASLVLLYGAGSLAYLGLGEPAQAD
jgi:hypothetical protein